MKPEVVKIKIKMGLIEVEMTLEEAKELQRTLNEAFGYPPTTWYPVYPVDPTVQPGITWSNETSDRILCTSESKTDGVTA